MTHGHPARPVTHVVMVLLWDMERHHGGWGRSGVGCCLRRRSESECDIDDGEADEETDFYRQRQKGSSLVLTSCKRFFLPLPSEPPDTTCDASEDDQVFADPPCDAYRPGRPDVFPLSLES